MKDITGSLELVRVHDRMGEFESKTRKNQLERFHDFHESKFSSAIVRLSLIFSKVNQLSVSGMKISDVLLSRFPE